MAEEINARIRHVGKTQAEWLADNTVLLAGELGYATDTQVIKIGNGQDTWRDLKSHQGEQGPQGPKGEPFTYEDLTAEQRLEIRGAEIDTSGLVSRNELSEAIENVDVSDQLDSKADVNHTHEIDDVNGLQDSLDGKAGIDHTHSEYVTADEVADLVPDVDLSDYYTKAETEDQFVHQVQVSDDGTIQYKRGDEWKQLTDSPKVALDTHSHDDRYSILGHTHPIYSKIGHTHPIADVLGLEARLSYLEENFDGLETILNESLDSFEARAESLEKLVEEPKIKQVTQSEYDELSNKDSNILYVVVE